MKSVIYLLLIMTIIIASDYDRNTWGTWSDDDKDGVNVRTEVLIKESNPEKLVIKDNKVISGEWVCPYTGKVITDPTKVDIDHTVPLYEAYVSGGDNWGKELKKRYFNYTKRDYHLIVTSISANRSKGSKDPSQWMPKYNGCEYLFKWITIKSEWNLTMDSLEREFIYNYIDNECLDK